MNYRLAINLTDKNILSSLAGLTLRAWLVSACLVIILFPGCVAEAQTLDSTPGREEIRAAISDAYFFESCCGSYTPGFAEQQRSRSRNDPANQDPDWDGLKRDTWYFMGAQVASLGVIYILPESVSGWSDEQKEEFGFSKWKENVSNPQIDKDDFVLNYVLHPYWGAAYYVRARERGYGKLNSFWYSVFLSTFFEIGPEALFEQPSIQDLIVTPVFGAWLGEYFMGLRSDIRERTAQRGHRSRRDNWLWYLTDPLDLLNTGVDRLFGRNTEIGFTPLIGSARPGRGLETERPNHLRQAMDLRGVDPSFWGSGNLAAQNFAGFRFSISW